MGYIPSNPNFAVVNCKIGDLDLTPIPPNVLEEFTYERVTSNGQANKLTIVVHDETAVVMESFLAEGNKDIEFSYGYNDGEMSDVYKAQMTEYDIDFSASGATLTIQAISDSVTSSFEDPQSVTYKGMTIMEIIQSIADEEGWIIAEDSIEPMQDVEESQVYSIATAVASGSVSSFSDAVAGGGGSTSDGSLSAMQQKVVQIAQSHPFAGSGYCERWAEEVFEEAGIERVYEGGARDSYQKYCKSDNRADLKPAMIVAVAPSGGTGNAWGHIGIYIGNDQVAHNADSVRIDSLDKWISMYGPNGPVPHSNPVKWGWYTNKVLA